MNARAALVLSILAAIGCSSEPPPSPPAAAKTSGAELNWTPRQDGMKVEGILGTIPQRKIEEILHDQLPAFQRCFFEGAGEVPELAGHMKFYFHVGLDGHVEWVSPRGSSIGHRPTELCLLERASRVHFPAPKGGGPAEFVWGFEVETLDGSRPPEKWSEDRVAPALAEHRAELSACKIEGSHYIVTAYVAPGGNVLAAGAAADSEPAAEKIDCIVDAVKGWKLPDPGAYAAKVSFGL
jgi:hypothetical protein